MEAALEAKKKVLESLKQSTSSARLGPKRVKPDSAGAALLRRLGKIVEGIDDSPEEEEE